MPGLPSDRSEKPCGHRDGGDLRNDDGRGMCRPVAYPKLYEEKPCFIFHIGAMAGKGKGILREYV